MLSSHGMSCSAGSRGLFTTSEGLKIAYLSGVQSKGPEVSGIDWWLHFRLVLTKGDLFYDSLYMLLSFP